MSTNDSYVHLSSRGKASAHHHQFADGREIVIIEIGHSATIHIPFGQAAALHAGLTDALAAFEHAPSKAVA